MFTRIPTVTPPKGFALQVRVNTSRQGLSNRCQEAVDLAKILIDTEGATLQAGYIGDVPAVRLVAGDQSLIFDLDGWPIDPDNGQPIM